MSYTKQDCLDKILDISTNLQSCLTEVAAKGVTVPADSSLDDLGTLIAQIPDASHPDYALPWMVSDGDHSFLLPVRATAAENNIVGIKAELTPNTNNDVRYVIGTMSDDGNLSTGLQQMSAGFRARFKLFSISNNEIVTNENNYAGLNSQWSDSSCPYYKQIWFYQGVTSTSNFLATLQGPSTATAGSGLAQPSGSILPNIPYGLLAAARMHDDVDNPYLYMTNPAQQGTKIFDCSIFTGTWSSKTSKFHFKPVLHWDSSWGKYRPCWKEDYNSGSYYGYSTFAIASNGSQVDSSVEGAYYIDVTQGLSELSVNNITGGRSISTIPYKIDGDTEYTMYSRLQTIDSNNWAYSGNLIFFVGDGSGTQIRVNSERPSGSTTTWNNMCRFYTSYSGNTYKQIYSSTTSSIGAYNYILQWTPSVSGTFGIKYYGGTGSGYSSKISGGSVTTNYSVSDLPIKLYLHYTTSPSTRINGVNWIRVRKVSTNEITNFLVLCKKSDNTYCYYDVMTKTLYE